MLLSNIGKEFRKQMESWFKEHPEVTHTWKQAQLQIGHPKKPERSISFHFDAKSITVAYKESTKVFQRSLFRNISEQVFQIRGYWVHEFLSKEDAEIPKPKLEDHQVVAMICNSRFGQVLTVDKNIFTGWGKVHHIFESIAEAREFDRRESKDDRIEIHFFDSSYNLIDIQTEGKN